MATDLNHSGAAETLAPSLRDKAGKKPFKDAAPPREPETLSPRQTRKLQLHQDSFAADLAARLSLFLRAEFSVTLADVRTAPYQQMTESWPEPAHLTLFKTEPLRGVSILEIPTRLGLCIVDRLMGGPGEVAGGPARTQRHRERPARTSRANRHAGMVRPLRPPQGTQARRARLRKQRPFSANGSASFHHAGRRSERRPGRLPRANATRLSLCRAGAVDPPAFPRRRHRHRSGSSGAGRERAAPLEPVLRQSLRGSPRGMAGLGSGRARSPQIESRGCGAD